MTCQILELVRATSAGVRLRPARYVTQDPLQPCLRPAAVVLDRCIPSHKRKMYQREQPASATCVSVSPHTPQGVNGIRPDRTQATRSKNRNMAWSAWVPSRQYNCAPPFAAGRVAATRSLSAKHLRPVRSQLVGCVRETRKGVQPHPAHAQIALSLAIQGLSHAFEPSRPESGTTRQAGGPGRTQVAQESRYVV